MNKFVHRCGPADMPHSNQGCGAVIEGRPAWEEGLKAVDRLAQPPSWILSRGDNLHINLLFM